MQIRQIALVARDLEPVVSDLCAVLGIEVSVNDPGVAEFGLHNAVMPLGDGFLEVVSPTRDGTTAGRFLDRRGGDGGYMVILQTDDLDAARARAADAGVRVVWEVTLPDIATIHLHPRDLGGAIVSFDAALPPDSWRWAGPGWQSHVRSDVTTGLAAIEIQTGDPAAMAARWATVLGRPTNARHEIPLDRGVIRFVPDRDGRGEGLAQLDVGAVDRQKVLDAARARGLVVEDDVIRICGIRVRVR